MAKRWLTCERLDLHLTPRRDLRGPEAASGDQEDSMGIFLSYSSRDSEVVKSLTRDIKLAGKSVWFDDVLTGGDEWWGAILRQIQLASLFVLALSGHAEHSRHCQAELK
jgi:hypothetical protein